jgi:pilus assembly protein CpaE
MPRAMLVQHPHLITDVQTAVITVEFTLAAARDAIRILSWFKSNAPQSRVIVVANRVHPTAQQEISRKDFEGSIERKVDYLIPYDAKLTAQAAKLGKPIAEAGKGSKTVAPLAELVLDILDASDSSDEERAAKKGKAAATGGSLLGKLSGLTAKLPGKAAKK